MERTLIRLNAIYLSAFFIIVLQHVTKYEGQEISKRNLLQFQSSLLY